MSDFEPPLPPTPSPAGPSYPGAPASPNATPAGYVNYGQMPVQLAEPSGLRMVTLVGFGCVSLFCFVLGAVAYQRGGLFEDFIAGDATVQDLKDSDDRVQMLAVTLLVLQVAAAVVLAIWANRTVKNMATRRPYDGHRPGLAAGSWFIPFANLGVPWGILRKAHGPTNLPRSLALWQGMFIGQAVLNLIARNTGDVENASSATDAVDRLHRQGLLFFGTAVLLSIGTAAAWKAMPAIDRATSGAAESS